MLLYFEIVSLSHRIAAHLFKEHVLWVSSSPVRRHSHFIKILSSIFKFITSESITMANLEVVDFALCIIPPKYLWPQIDRVRSRHDRNFPSWPPHIKLTYPFVPFKWLATHLETITEAVENFGPIRIRLGATDEIHNEEVFLHADDAEHVDEDGGRTFPLDRLCEAVLEAVPGLKRGSRYRSMTVGHILEGESADEAQSLLLRAGCLSGIEWEVDELHVLATRHFTSGPSPGRARRARRARMIDWGSISLRDGGLRVHQKRDTRLLARVVDGKVVAGHIEIPGVREFYSDYIPQTPEGFVPFFYNGIAWIPSTPDLLQQRALSAAQRTLAVSSYNVLGRTDNPAILTQSILHSDAEADVLVLQEATSTFLSHLLHNKSIQERYTFCTHQPLDHGEGGAAPIQKMVVVLSKYAFDWETIPLPQNESEPGYVEQLGKYHVGHDDLSNGEVENRTLAKGSVTEHRTRTHNRALLVEFRKSEDSTEPLKRQTPLALAAFHLTPDCNYEGCVAKALELDAIRHYIYWGTPTILAGSFNMATSMFTLRCHELQEFTGEIERDLLLSGYVDAWMFMKMNSGAETDDDSVVPKFQGEQGPTGALDIPGTVAADSDLGGVSRRPQRLDRIFVKPHDLLMVQSFNKFGRFPNADEDVVVNKNFHLGVRAVVKLERSLNSLHAFGVAEDSATSLATHLDIGPSPLLRGHESVLEALRDVHGFPLLAERRLRATALEVLRFVLGESRRCGKFTLEKSKTGLVVLPVGSYGLDVWTSSSDLDCLCFGTFSLPTFIDLAVRRIQYYADKSGLRFLKNQDTYTGTTLELVYEHNLRIDLTYARTAWPLSSSDPATHLPHDTLMALKPYRELDYVQRSVPDIVEFRLAHRFIKKWAESRGIYSRKLGYLDGIQITMLLTRVHKRLVTKLASPAAPEILLTFFKEYSNFDWEKEVVVDACFHRTLTYSRTSLEPLAILSYFPPRLNVSPGATISSVRTITAEFQRAAKVLDQVGAMWADLLRVSLPGVPTSGSLASDEFLKCHPCYIKIDVQYWGGSTTKGRGFVAWVESRLPSLVADLDNRILDTHFRVWPTRFKEDSRHILEQSESAANEGEYQGVFIVGLDWMGKAKKSIPLHDSRDSLLSILGSFERNIRKDERHFDVAFMNFRYELQRSLFVPISSNDKQSAEPRSHRLQIDDRNWDAYLQGDGALEDKGEGQKLGEATTVQSEWSASFKNKRKSATNQPQSAVGLKPSGARKFRTAADVANRLRWDASYDHNDFVVGYEDRFLGTMERGLDAWKSEQTHEEFIPQHRILYFKRRSDGKVVWERRARLDLVFGSG